MPLLNGLDAGEQLKALHSEIKVIYLTQNREPRLAAEAFRRKASGYLLKIRPRRADDRDSTGVTGQVLCFSDDWPGTCWIGPPTRLPAIPAYWN
jgi:hypothetical protein